MSKPIYVIVCHYKNRDIEGNVYSENSTIDGAFVSKKCARKKLKECNNPHYKTNDEHYTMEEVELNEEL